MNRRKTHYDPGGRTPFDDGDEFVYCGTALLEGDFTGKEATVTCKRCLNAMAARSRRIAKEMEPRKAELYDEVWGLARSLGWMNVTDAITKAGRAGDFYQQSRKESR